jgi:hypothetical protein
MTIRPDYPTVLLFAGLSLAGVASAAEPQTEAVPATATQAVDPAAMQALDRMGAYLRGLPIFNLEANDATDEVLESGEKIQLLKTVALQVRKPDHLHAEVATDRKAREIFYDGKQFTLLAPETGYYATVPAPASIRELLTEIETKFGIELPLVDLFHWGENADAATEVTQATVVGTSKIAGQAADHYAFRQDDIDWQIWIAQGDAPLPLRYVITTKDLPGEPQYAANLSWNTQVRPDDAVFTFTPTADNHPIAIAVRDDSQATPQATSEAKP